MTLKIQALTFNKQPMVQPVAADFGEAGGSIGRATDNTLVLPDEKRYISRTQALIAFRAGSYFLQDHGSASPTLVNGAALGSGNEIPLKHGDRITIGEYSLCVTIAAAAGAEKAPHPEQDPAGDEVAHALVSALGLKELQAAGKLTPEVAGLIGQVLREAIRGTLDLLVARALMKRDVRARATVIIAKENNPLKVSPNVETALGHLLGSERPGFLPPVAAMRDAYNDLRSHQLGIMAGMQAALAGVLARFDPAQLEQRLEAGTTSGLMPANRRARLWESYEQLYREIMKEAEDDFHKLFNDEFVRGYETEIDRLKRENAGKT